MTTTSSTNEENFDSAMEFLLSQQEAAEHEMDSSVGLLLGSTQSSTASNSSFLNQATQPQLINSQQALDILSAERNNVNNSSELGNGGGAATPYDNNIHQPLFWNSTHNNNFNGNGSNNSSGNSVRFTSSTISSSQQSLHSSRSSATSSATTVHSSHSSGSVTSNTTTNERSSVGDMSVKKGEQNKRKRKRNSEPEYENESEKFMTTTSSVVRHCYIREGPNLCCIKGCGFSISPYRTGQGTSGLKGHVLEPKRPYHLLCAFSQDKYRGLIDRLKHFQKARLIKSPDSATSHWSIESLLRGEHSEGPPHSLIARNFHSQSLTSAPVESEFSKAKRVVGEDRALLDPEQLERLMLLRSWMETGTELDWDLPTTFNYNFLKH